MSAMFENLESRTLLTSVNLESGVLSIEGSRKVDTVTVSQSETYVVVNIGAKVRKQFRASKVDRIEIRTLDGPDVVRLTSVAGQETSIRAFIDGGAGGDQLGGGNGRDTIVGGTGDDQIDGFASHDRLDGGTGHDKLWGGEGYDKILAGDGDDDVYGDASSLAPPVAGRPGNDTIVGGAGNDKLFGDFGNDLIKGDAGFDLLQGNDGADTMHGGTDDDTLWGGGGTDALLPSLGNDEVRQD